MHCHHEKLVIVDDELAFVGGIDLTTLAGDRYDSNEHPHKEQEIGWHDASALLRGPIVRDVAAHFALRWEATAGEALALPEALAAGRRDDRPVRPHRARGRLPRAPARRVLRARDLHPRAALAREHLIYLENQFLWSPEIVHILETQAAQPAVRRLPRRRPAPAPGQQRPGRHARDARPPRRRRRRRASNFLAATIMSRTGERSGPLYVHAKIGIVDDEWLAIGSANLNEHSLFNDTEVDVVTCDPALARATRLRLWAEHLEREDASGDPARLVDERWRPIASEQLERQRAGAPLTHHLVELPGVSRRSRRLLGPLDALVVDG